MANKMPPQLRMAHRGKYKRVLFEDLFNLDIGWLAKNKWVERGWGEKHLILYSEHKHVADLRASIKQLNIICRDGHRQRINLHQRYHHGRLRYGHPSFRLVFI